MNPEQQTLVDRLIEAGLNTRRFLKLTAEKAAFEPEWEKHLYGPEMLEGYPYWGLCGKDGLVLLDADKVSMDQKLREILPPTFEVKSPRRGLTHFYLKVIGEPVQNKTLHFPGEEEGSGEVRSQNYYLVAPGTEIRYRDLRTSEPRIGRYTITQNRPIATVSYEIFMKMIEPYLGSNPKQPITFEQMREGVPQGIRHFQGIKYATFLVGVQKFDYATALAEMLRWNQLCKPPMDEDDLKRMVKNALGYVTNNPQEKEPQKEENMEPFPNFFTYVKGVRVFQPVVFADYLLTRYNFKTTSDDETIFVYDDLTGIYKPSGEITVKIELARYLQENTRSYYLTDILFYIRAKTYFDRPKTPSSKIACKNGLLNLETLELEDFTPDEFITIQIPVSFAPGIDCPKIKKFISEVVAEQDVQVIQEQIGYCLYPKMFIHKAGLFDGGGANAKSTTLNLVKCFLGPDNVTSLTLQEICNDKPAKAALYGKLANLCADLPSKTLTNTGVFKTLTGDDNVSARELYKNYFTFKNTAKLLFSANEIPQTEDYSNAFFRRWIIIKFPNVFTGKKCNPNILNEITTPTEMAGLLNWALEGLQRLLKNGEFSNSKTIEQDRENYLKLSNSPVPYIETQLQYSQDTNHIIPEQLLYANYCSWCRKNGYKSTRKADFTKTLYQVLPGIEQGERTINKKRVKCYIYIAPSTASTAFASATLIFIGELAGKKYIEVLAEAGKAGEAPSCAICVQPLSEDMAGTTFYNGQAVHMVCFQRLKDKEAS